MLRSLHGAARSNPGVEGPLDGPAQARRALSRALLAMLPSDARKTGVLDDVHSRFLGATLPSHIALAARLQVAASRPGRTSREDALFDLYEALQLLSLQTDGGAFRSESGGRPSVSATRVGLAALEAVSGQVSAVEPCGSAELDRTLTRHLTAAARRARDWLSTARRAPSIEPPELTLLVACADAVSGRSAFWREAPELHPGRISAALEHLAPERDDAPLSLTFLPAVLALVAVLEEHPLDTGAVEVLVDSLLSEQHRRDGHVGESAVLTTMLDVALANAQAACLPACVLDSVEEGLKLTARARARSRPSTELIARRVRLEAQRLQGMTVTDFNRQAGALREQMERDAIGRAAPGVKIIEQAPLLALEEGRLVIARDPAFNGARRLDLVVIRPCAVEALPGTEHLVAGTVVSVREVTAGARNLTADEFDDGLLVSGGAGIGPTKADQLRKERSIHAGHEALFVADPTRPGVLYRVPLGELSRVRRWF